MFGAASFQNTTSPSPAPDETTAASNVFDDSWDQFIKFDEEPAALPLDYDFFSDPEGLLSPTNPTPSEVSPSLPFTPSPNAAWPGDLTGVPSEPVLREPCLPYLHSGAHGTNYIDFNLYSPASDFLDEEPQSVRKLRRNPRSDELQPPVSPLDLNEFRARLFSSPVCADSGHSQPSTVINDANSADSSYLQEWAHTSNFDTGDPGEPGWDVPGDTRRGQFRSLISSTSPEISPAISSSMSVAQAALSGHPGHQSTYTRSATPASLPSHHSPTPARPTATGQSSPSDQNWLLKSRQGLQFASALRQASPAVTQVYNGLPSVSPPYNGLPGVRESYHGLPSVSQSYNSLPAISQSYNGLPPSQATSLTKSGSSGNSLKTLLSESSQMRAPGVRVPTPSEGFTLDSQSTPRGVEALPTPSPSSIPPSEGTPRTTPSPVIFIERAESTSWTCGSSSSPQTSPLSIVLRTLSLLPPQLPSPSLGDSNRVNTIETGPTIQEEFSSMSDTPYRRRDSRDSLSFAPSLILAVLIVTATPLRHILTEVVEGSDNIRPTSLYGLAIFALVSCLVIFQLQASLAGSTSDLGDFAPLVGISLASTLLGRLLLSRSSTKLSKSTVALTITDDNVKSKIQGVAGKMLDLRCMIVRQLTKSLWRLGARSSKEVFLT